VIQPENFRRINRLSPPAQPRLPPPQLTGEVRPNVAQRRAVTLLEHDFDYARVNLPTALKSTQNAPTITTVTIASVLKSKITQAVPHGGKGDVYMQNSYIVPRTILSRLLLVAIGASAALVLTGIAGAKPPLARTLDGDVVALVDKGLAGYSVTLYGSFIGKQDTQWRRLGATITDSAGAFHIAYSLPEGGAKNQQPLLFVEAERGPIMLASAIGSAPDAPTHILVNERTTVATANAFAQFVNGRKIEGNPIGMVNAVYMAANLADPRTGDVGKVLALIPNGPSTSTLSTFNSLANVVSSCVADTSNCDTLFQVTTPAGGPPPSSLLQAVANIVKYPSYPGYPADASDPVYQLSLVDPAYKPALTARPTNWLLFLKFTGGLYEKQDSDNLMNGPGNVSIDAQGNAWVNDNYVPQPEGHFACAGLRLLKFHPWGENYSNSPFFGGGLSGAGYGITLDPKGHVWIGNFGFQNPPCAQLPQAATNNSVSEFDADGTPISPPSGITQRRISWPQGTVSDRKGNIWIANCGNDSVTKIPHGEPSWAFNIRLGRHYNFSGEPKIKPFSIATDLNGNVWVTNNLASTVSVLSSDGIVIDTIQGTYRGKTILNHPIGNAADTAGNIWVANSDYLNAPCPNGFADQGPGMHPSVTLLQAKNHQPYPHSPFKGGGITLPWGIAVDGDDTAWVFNFGSAPVHPGNSNYAPTAISRFCGINTKKCPKGMNVGDPISPRTGYTSDALGRLTGGQFDPSGNIWIMNNWKKAADPFMNPGGNSIVIVVGAAGPIKTPLIGPPVSFDHRSDTMGRGFHQ
jgi:hypothetical protein